MPQLDKLSFLTQVLWFFFTFSSLYIFLILYGLPAIGSALKMRQKLLLSIKNTPMDQTGFQVQSTVQEIGKIVNRFNLRSRDHLQTLEELTTSSGAVALHAVLGKSKSFTSLKAVVVKELQKNRVRASIYKKRTR